MKKIIAVFVLFMSVICSGAVVLLPEYSAEAETGTQIKTDIQFKYSENSDGGIAVTGVKDWGNGFDGILEIPSEIDGHKVTSIYENSFLGKQEITSLIIPDTVKTIRHSAFSNCNNLKEIDFGNRVTDIQFYAFSSCDSIETIVIPDNVSEMGDNVFANCDNLKEVTIGKKLFEIPYSAFAGCYSLEKVILGKNTKTIDEYAFQGCKLKSIFIPNTVTRIKWGAFDSINENTVINYNGTEALWKNIAISPDNNFDIASINYNTDMNGNAIPVKHTEAAVLISVYGIVFLAVIAFIIVLIIKSGKKCRKCGTKQAKEAKFCTQCGNKL